LQRCLHRYRLVHQLLVLLLVTVVLLLLLLLQS
jgi:hypothetical protein